MTDDGVGMADEAPLDVGSAAPEAGRAVDDAEGFADDAGGASADGVEGAATDDPPPLDPRTREFLTRPALTRLWTTARTRLERNGLQPTGTVRLQNLDAAERETLSLLLARPITGATATIRLPDLDARLRATAVRRGLAATLTALGPPLVDRRAARDAASAERTRHRTEAESALAATPLADHPWAHRWLEETHRTATLTTIVQAIRTLARLFPSTQPWGRGELATHTTGSAHGLDDDTPLSRLVLRGIALAHNTDFPTDAPARRALWRTAGVTPDEVSSTVLTYGLRPTGKTWQETALRERADHHLETHLTLRELRTLTLDLTPHTHIHVCENPRVLEAAADSARTTPLICTSGSAATVVLTLLDTLTRSGCTLAYHGDFDWPGITLANRIIGRYDAQPWRMGTDDYEYLAMRAKLRGTPALPLSGPRVEADWDPELASAMESLGVALHEEAAIELLLEDLTPRP